jgi:hypothetical protein
VRILPPLVVLALSTAPADGAPRADLVVVWAPGMRITPIEGVVKGAGAALIDRSPAPPGGSQTVQLIQAGMVALEKPDFKLDEVWQLLEQARTEVDRTGAAGLTEAQLSDLFLYRGLVKVLQGETDASWDQLVNAVTVSPTRELDPARFPENLRELYKRARDIVSAKPRARLTVTAPEGCTINVDGRPSVGAVERPLGPHWISTTCSDRRPHGYKIELTGEVTVPVEPSPFLPPSDTEMLVQARTAGARAFVAAEVRAGVGTARLVGLDGRERDRRTVTITSDLGPLADAIAELIKPPPATKWYQSKYVWAAGAVVLTGIIAIPLTLAFSGDQASADFGLKVPVPWL